MLALDPLSEHHAGPTSQAGALRPVDSPITALRVRAIADANALRALARAALRDGMPRGEARAATSRAAARAVLAHARRLSVILEKGDRPWTRGLRRNTAA
jgi:hypothetical protein